MYIEDNDKYSCSGCTACKNICPTNAIEMKEDFEGFKYPKIDKNKCINCKSCINICPNIKKFNENTILEVYGAKHKNVNERRTSRSGAVFIAISDYILQNKGVIYGAKLNKDFSVTHERATTIYERNEFKGSKYVQSDMGNVIAQVRNDLQNGKKVLFSGTPCQVSAVKTSINTKLYENLYTCDIICYGVPSKRIYMDFLAYIEKKYNKKIKQFIFRDKEFGWDTHYETIIFEDNTKISTQYFKNLFYSYFILRPSCHKCNFANVHRPADLTIGDFWGIENINLEFKDKLGVSLVIINNNKGKKLFSNAKKDLDIIECSIEDCINNTYTLSNVTPEAENRSEFWEDYNKNGFDYIIQKYAK